MKRDRVLHKLENSITAVMGDHTFTVDKITWTIIYSVNNQLFNSVNIYLRPGDHNHESKSEELNNDYDAL